MLLAATTGYQTQSFAAAARRLNVTVKLATDRCHILEDPWRDQAVAVRFDEPRESARELAGTLDLLRVDGIAAVADRPTLVAAYLAEFLGLPWHPVHAVAACRDKHRMRMQFADAGLPTPSNAKVALDETPPDFDFPCVLKPLGLSASRGVIRADNRAELENAFARIRRILEQPEILAMREHANRAIQIEEYIPGREFAVEGVMTDGVLRVLAVFDKPDPLEGPYFEESIYVTPSREAASVQEAIVNTTRRAARALGLWHGPIHAEMRVNESGVYMLEIAARPIGGLCARALRFRMPGREDTFTLEELLVLHTIGEMPAQLAPASAASGVMMIPVPRAGVFESVSGVEKARAIPGIDDVVITAKPGEKLVPLPEGAGYPGFLFASGPDAGFVEEALRRAHGELRFDVLGTLPVVL